MSNKTIKGKTYLKEDSTYSDGLLKKHLYCVISDPDQSDNVLVISINRCKGHPSEKLSCILGPGDHSYIKEKSYVRFDLACECNEKKLVELSLTSKIKPFEKLKPEVLKRIQQTAKYTNAIPRGLKKYFNNF